MEDLDELKGEISDADLCDVIESLLLDLPAADYPIVADTLPPRWIIGKIRSLFSRASNSFRAI
jgi:hypothetical protein